MSSAEGPDRIKRTKFAHSVVLGENLDRHTAAVLDSRMAGVGTREISSLYYHTLKVKTSEAEQKKYGRNIGRAKHLMFLLDEDRMTLSEMRKAARASRDEDYMSSKEHKMRTDYIEKSDNQKEIKAILLELGLTEMLLFGDWKVNREGGERPQTESLMPTGELGNEILAEARTLRRAIMEELKPVVVAKAKRIGELINLPDSVPSAVAIALRELKKTEAASNLNPSISGKSDIAVEASASRDISDSMGIVPFNQVESLILQFHHENGLLMDTAPIVEGKLAALDLGCGNGVTGEWLRRDPTDPFGNQRQLVNYWAEIGFADKIYWTLENLMYRLIREEHRNDPAILEFVEVVSMLLIRKINNLKRFPPKHPSKDDKKYNETVLLLPTNPNVIRVILPHLGDYIPTLKKLKKIKADGEFEADSEYQISPACRALIQDYFDGPELFRAVCEQSNEIFEPSQSGKKRETRAFLQTYFRDESVEHSDKIERLIRSNQEEFDSLKQEYGRTTEEMKSLTQRRDTPASQPADATERETLESQIAKLIERRKALKGRERELIKVKQELAEQRTDLAGEITIYPHNVILGDFADFKKTMPDVPTFDWVRSCRASSHADDKQYADLIEECAYLLKPGGIITEDGKRESYTRFERVEQLQALQRKLGGEYRVNLIAKPNGPSAVLIERAVVRKDGETVFFSEQKGRQFLRDDVQLVPVDMFAARWPEMVVRNILIERFRSLFISSVIRDCGSEEAKGRIYRGRMEFSNLHHPLDEQLREHLFKNDEWNNNIRNKSPGDPEYDDYIEKVWGVVSSEILKVRRRIETVAKGAMLVRREDDVIRTFPPKFLIDREASPAILERRSHKIRALPRNIDIPDLSDAKLERERQSLVTTLTEIAKLTGKPPLRLHLYDCFTDPAMLDTILTLLGAHDDPQKTALFQTVNVKIEGRYDPSRNCEVYNYPQQETGVIDIFGGSTNDAYDDGGKNYIAEFILPWLNQIDRHAPVRGLGICFGSQCILEGLGKLRGFDVKTQRGALQFGPFPVVFDKRHVAVKHLENKACTAVFTRSGYSIPDDNLESRANLRPLAYEGKLDSHGIWVENRELPPVAYSLLDGRVITTQLHLETSLRDSRHLKPLSRYAGRHAAELSKVFGPTLFFGKNPLASPNYLRDGHFGLDAKNIFGEETKWVAKDVGMAFLIPSLLHLANDLLVELRKAMPLA